MIRKLFHILTLTAISTGSFAGNEDYPVGARSAAMGNASVSLSDVWSAHHNQAGLGFVRNISAGVSYENRFLIKEISVRGGVVAVPVKGGTFGLCITNFGFNLYSENKYSLSFAKAFGEKFAMGIAMDYLTTRIAEGYGTRGVLAAEVGMQAKPIKGLTIGVHAFNPTRAKLADYNNERLPTIIRLGADYEFSEKVILAIETQKDIQYKAEFKAGIEYKAVKEFYLRLGVSTNP
ncbi:MAG: hypothetical protein JNL69_07665, partial [Bacteroidia bacterium]|nr:hypothetical protein [Bacteroidia bacterium]